MHRPKDPVLLLRLPSVRGRLAVLRGGHGGDHCCGRTERVLPYLISLGHNLQ